MATSPNHCQLPIEYLDTKQAAEWLGLSPRTLEGLRHRGGGPLYKKWGPKLVRYAISDLRAWADTAGRRNTSDEGNTIEVSKREEAKSSKVTDPTLGGGKRLGLQARQHLQE